MATAVEPGVSFGHERRTAWYGVSAASVRGAAWTGSRPVGERDQVPRARHEHQLGHPAVGPEASASRGHVGVLRAVAVGLQTRAAVLAPSAAPGADHGNRLAGLEPGDTVTEQVDPAGVLVPERERRPPRKDAVLELVHQVQVGVAGAGASHLDDHLARAGLGVGDLPQDRFAVP